MIGAAERPNILLIVSDDQGYGDVSCYWDTDLRTPMMDAVAAAGVRFSKFRVNPLCAPTRSSFMTGLYSLENGMWRGPGEKSKRDDPPAGGWDPSVRRIKDDVKMLPQLGASYRGAERRSGEENIMANLSADELVEWRAAVAKAESEGTFFIARPYHCAVGTIPE